MINLIHEFYLATILVSRTKENTNESQNFVGFHLSP